MTVSASHRTPETEPGPQCSVCKSLKFVFLPASGPIQPGDLGLTCGHQTSCLSAGTQESLSLDNNSQELRDPGQGARDKLTVTHAALDGLPGCGCDITVTGDRPNRSPWHRLLCVALHTRMKNRLACLCAPPESTWEGMGPGFHAVIYNEDAVV